MRTLILALLLTACGGAVASPPAPAEPAAPCVSYTDATGEHLCPEPKAPSAPDCQCAVAEEATVRVSCFCTSGPVPVAWELGRLEVVARDVCPLDAWTVRGAGDGTDADVMARAVAGMPTDDIGATCVAGELAVLERDLCAVAPAFEVCP